MPRPSEWTGRVAPRARLALRALGYWAVAAAIVAVTLAVHRHADEADRLGSHEFAALSQADLAARGVLDALSSARADVHLLAALGVVGDWVRAPSLLRRTALSRDLFAFVATRSWCERVVIAAGDTRVVAERRAGAARCEPLAAVAAGLPSSEAVLASVRAPDAVRLCIGVSLGARADGVPAVLLAEADPRRLFPELDALGALGGVVLRDSRGEPLLEALAAVPAPPLRPLRLPSWSGPSAGTWQLGVAVAHAMPRPPLRGDVAVMALLLVASAAGALALARASLARRLAEQAAQRQLALFQCVSDNVPSPIFLKDGMGRYLGCNAAFERLVGYTRDAIVGRDVGALLTPAAATEHEQADRAILGDGLPRQYETHLVGPAGRVRDLLVSKSAVRDDSGRITGITAALVDITERKAAERDLQRSLEALRAASAAAEAGTRAKSEFLAMMSHEMRTPLHAVLGASGLLLESPLTDVQREQAALSRTAGQALLDLIDDLLDYSRLEAGRLDLERVPFDPRQLTSDTLALVAGAARAKGLELVSAMAPDVPERATGDPGRVRQVLLKLLGNAIEFTESGSVRVQLEVAQRDATGSRLRLTVKDTGVGIPEELLSRLFQPFARGDVPVGRTRTATGLGLSITRRLVELMGGTIEATSTPGAGSEFRCVVPLGPAPADEPKPPPAKADRRGLKVLVVEDNRVNQRVTRALLERLGCAVDVAEDGSQALAAVSRSRYDVVFMDCSMPGMSGYEATREIRRREGGGNGLPIVALTAHALRGDRERCLAAGMTDYLAKPVELRALEGVLARLAEGPAEKPAPPPAAEPSPEPQRAAALVDVQALASLRSLEKDGPGFMVTIVREFDEGARHKLDEMQLAARGGDLPALRGAAHTLKGSAGIFGARGMAELCRRLEHAADQGEASAAAPLIARLTREHEAVMAVLQEATASV
jgi:PAS domain S-box-containing protein